MFYGLLMDKVVVRVWKTEESVPSGKAVADGSV